MSQHDLEIANQGFAAFRQDLNDALQALGGLQSGADAPATTYANMFWYETDTDKLYIRNEDNDAWIELFTFDQVNDHLATIGATITLDGSGNMSLAGDLTVDTDTLYVDSTNNRVGIGTASPSSKLHVSGDSQRPVIFQRNTTDGNIVDLSKDGSVVGQIGAIAGNAYIGSSNTGVRFQESSLSIFPCNSNGSGRDNAIDVGNPSVRFDDIRATNGTIQTSDRNDKQQIASLTDAEVTAAKVISTLFKTFKWNDKVEEKGGAARTHTGVIAQDVQQAMNDAGLDVGDYAFFISDTWWEADGESYDTAEEAPEGATERTRLGIRYPELLAFVGAATEQRLADIETRLTALEAI
jgi:hypothetical protein